MINNPYQTTPMINSGYVPQYGSCNYNPMTGTQRYQPQQEQLFPTQMPGTSQQIFGINGRVVPDVSSINANEVPMDGSMAFFPKQDLSEIYVKGWNADGTIRTTIFKPVSSNNGTNTQDGASESKISLSEEVTGVIMKRFDELFGKIEQLEDRFDKSLGSQRKTSRTQNKEGDSV